MSCSTVPVIERLAWRSFFFIIRGCFLVSCIKSLRNDTKGQYVKSQNFSTFVDNFTNVSKPNGMAYKKLVNTKQKSPTKSQEKWCVDYSLERPEEIDWEMAYRLPFCSTKVTKLIMFQFKLLHRRLATNDFLKKHWLKRKQYLYLLWNRERVPYSFILDL